MNRKITFRAFAGKCVRFGSSGFFIFNEAAAASPRSAISEASAMEPMPIEHRPKKWRRVMSRRFIVFIRE
jgi:hypothetical protein